MRRFIARAIRTATTLLLEAQYSVKHAARVSHVVAITLPSTPAGAADPDLIWA